MDRYAKYGNHNDKHDAEVEETKDAVGGHLANHEAERLNGRHGELFEGSTFALADKAERDEQDYHDLQ